MRSFVVTIGSGPLAPGSTLREMPMRRTVAVHALRRGDAGLALAAAALEPRDDDLDVARDRGRRAAARRACRAGPCALLRRAPVSLGLRRGLPRAPARPACGTSRPGRSVVPLRAGGDEARVVGRGRAQAADAGRSPTATRRTSARSRRRRPSRRTPSSRPISRRQLESDPRGVTRPLMTASVSSTTIVWIVASGGGRYSSAPMSIAAPKTRGSPSKSVSAGRPTAVPASIVGEPRS